MISTDLGLAKIVTFYLRELLTSSYLDQLKKLLEEISKGKTDDKPEMRGNYSEDRFALSHQEAVSLILIDNKIHGFSTLYNNPLYYGKNNYRCLNRLYLTNTLRSHFSIKGRGDVLSPAMAIQQLSMVRKKEPYFLFVSRQAPKSRWSKQFSINLTKATGLSWHEDGNLYPVCCRSASACWHHIIYHRVCSDDDHPFYGKGMSLQDYNQRKF